MKKYCENCGERFYSRGCVNCNEVNYIEEQYHDLGMSVPELIVKKQSEDRERDKLYVKDQEHRKTLGI